jgi:hypothetical protein
MFTLLLFDYISNRKVRDDITKEFKTLLEGGPAKVEYARS